MLADHVEAPCLGFLYVEAEGIVSGSGIKAVRPPALVQRTILEENLIVQRQPPGALGNAFAGLEGIRISLCRYLPERRITGHLVHRLALTDYGYVQAVKVGIGGRPEFGFGDGEEDIGPIGTCKYGSGRHFCTVTDAAFKKLDLDNVPCLKPGGLHMDAELGVIHIGLRQIRDDGRLRNGLQPYCLPDSGDGGVPDAPGMGHLLAARLPALVRCIQHLHLQLLLTALFQEACDVEGERGISAGVDSGLLSVHPDLRLPVHGTKVEQHTLTLPLARNGETAHVPEGLIRTNFLPNAGELRFHCKRHQNLSLGGLEGIVLIQDGIVPFPVEVGPGRPYHLRTRILRQRGGRVHLRGPAGRNIGHGLCPGGKTESSECKEYKKTFHI